MRRPWMLLLIPLLGCGNCSTEEDENALSVVIEAGTPQAVVVDGGVGVGEVALQIRMVNQYGVAIPAETGSVELAIGGSDVESSGTVVVDALGYGELVVTSSVPQELDITVLNASDGANAGATGKAWLVGAEAPKTAFFPAWDVELQPSYLEAVDQGLLLSVGSEVYYQDGLPTAPPSRVASLSSDVLGLASADFDRDGIEDAVLWTALEVILLRGRYGGGFSWGTGFSIPGEGIRGVGVGDANLDGIQDIVIAYGIESSGGFQVLQGSGAWTFEPQSPSTVPEDIWSVALCQLNDDGRADVALLVDDGTGLGEIQRFGPNAEGAWAENANSLGGQSLGNFVLTRGSRLLDCEDLLGTPATEELIAVGPVDQGDRPIVWYSFDGGSTTEYKLNYSGHRVSLGDVTGEGTTDVVLAEADTQQLRVVTWREDEGNFLNDAIVAVPMGGPVGVSDVDGDGAADILVSTDVLALYPGQVDEDGKWNILPDDFLTYGVRDLGEQAFADLDGDGHPEHVSVRSQDGETVLQLSTWQLNEDGVPSLQSTTSGQRSLDGQSNAAVAEPLDLAVCGSEVWVLVSDNGAHLFRFSVDGTTVTSSSVGEVDADFVACGSLGSATAVIATEAGTWQSVNDQLSVVDSGDFGSSVGDIVIADTTGDGDALEFCDAATCNLVAADLDGDGIDELLTGGDAPTAVGWGVDTAFAMPGQVSVFDWDQDGRMDVAITDTDLERVAIYRSLERSYAPPLILHGVRDLQGPAMSADLDGDGAPELAFKVLDGNLLWVPGVLE
ncbi:MAG: VCBS repeat-containing protein [Myxococcota bacterium]|nr:VCBS repeat-containing protein [Myxococcota bacterium]